MTVHFRLSSELYERMKTDLARPHKVAHERVGFVFARTSSAAYDTSLVLATDYLPVPDDLYQQPTNPLVGAEISAAAIRLAMQRVYSDRVNAFHIHAHQNMPRFSTIDRQGIPPIIESFGHAHPTGLHGALLLNDNELRGVTYHPSVTKLAPITRIVVVGYPMHIFEGDEHVW